MNTMKKKVLFIDRDGTLVIEPPVDYQLDAFEKLEFYPKVFRNLHFIRQKLNFEFVMVTNQDGLKACEKIMDRLTEKLSKEDYNLVEELQDQASIAQCEENECHFKVGFSAGLLVQQEAVEQVKKINDK